jgi:hypothetical protein
VTTLRAAVAVVKQIGCWVSASSAKKLCACFRGLLPDSSTRLRIRRLL